jgi:uncharacterized damage-inducible protein DinB
VSEKPITRERLLRILDGQAAKTAVVIAGLDEATLMQPARDDGWAARDILAHMAWAYEGFLAVGEGHVPGGLDPSTFNLDAFNEEQRRQVEHLSVAEVLEWLQSARRRIRECIEQLDEASYGEVVHTPWMGDHLRAQFMVFPALHEGGHRAELERWRAGLKAAAHE